VGLAPHSGGGGEAWRPGIRHDDPNAAAPLWAWARARSRWMRRSATCVWVFVDESRTAESRELISTLTENRTFRPAGSYPTPAALERSLSAGRLDVGVVVPYDFARLRARERPATVQVLLNAVNANTAQIAQGYVGGAIAWLNRRLEAARPLAGMPSPGPGRRAGMRRGLSAVGVSAALPTARPRLPGPPVKPSKKDTEG
jgi:hypothetical protein